MCKLSCSEFKPARRFMGRLPHGGDIVTSIEDFCRENSIQAGTLSLIGAVSSAVLGVYDQKQQVYVTWQVTGNLEILSCTGNISLKDGVPFVHAHILLADEHGKITGGHLFSETVAFAGEVEIVALDGDLLERAYDETTGLMLWS
ncbi:MAG: PPC domain-containing DNA-binding protein [Thermodesulfobacteriota bacterium]|nr:PPC domain-containing DNA-binding protein [Thermodesulfobacteriota bacterium]